MLSTYLGYQLYGRDPAQSLARVASEPIVETAKTYYDANIGKVKNVDDFINNYRLFSYAMSAYGLSDLTYAKALMRQVLTSDLTSATSVANKLNDPRYRAFAAAFGFTTTGAVATPSVQSATQQDATVAAFKANTTALSQTTVDDATSYYESHIGAATSLSALENDTKLYSFVLTAYGLNASTTSKATFESIVESNVADPKSEVNTAVGAGYAALNSAVNVTAPSLPGQTSDQIDATVTAYQATVPGDAASQAAAATETAYYKAAMSDMKTANGVVADARLVSYITKAFGLPAGTTSASIKSALTSTLSDPTSFANTSTTTAFQQVAQAFNFNSDGTLQTASTVVLPAQTVDKVTSTIAAYKATVGADAASQAAAATETAYYKATMATIGTADGVLNDPRLVSYITKAFSLPSGGATSAVIRSALTSDLGDPTSFANTTPIAAYKQLAQSFDFKTDGTLRTTPSQASSTVAVQAETADQIDATVAAYQNTVASDAASQSAAATETAYFKAAMSDMRTATGLVADARLVSYITQAFAVPAGTTSAAIKSALTSNLSDPTSFANTSSSQAFKQIAAAFNFKTDGTLKSTPFLTASTVTLLAQTSDQTSSTVAAFKAAVGTDTGLQAQAALDTTYFQATVPTIKTVDSLLKNPRLTSYIIKAFGLPLDASASTIKAVLTSDLTDPTSLANTMTTPGFKQLAQSFNFNTDGTLRTTPFQTATQVQDTVALYTARQSSDTTAVDSATAYYSANIGKVKTIADLEANSQLYTYVMTAYGIPSTASQATVEQVIDANPQSATGILATTPHAADLLLARAFTVDTTGHAADTLAIQGSDALAATTAAYNAAAKTDAASQLAATQETAYYKTATAAVTTVGALLSDKRLVAYIDTAFAMPAGTTTDHLNRVLTTSVKDSAKLNATDKKLWQAFSFNTNGLVASQAAGQAQSTYTIAATDASYVEQAMEDEAGNDNTGVQLALYFKRMAPTITSAYNILADKALLQFTQTVLGLSSTSSKSDIDVQARYITSHLNLADLKDPTKLNQLILRFAASYDAANPTDTSSITLLFGGSSS